MRESVRSISQVSSDACAGLVESYLNLADRCSALNVVTVHSTAKGDGGEEVFFEVLAELLQLDKRERV